jgi:hypothetical protein
VKTPVRLPALRSLTNKDRKAAVEYAVRLKYHGVDQLSALRRAHPDVYRTSPQFSAQEAAFRADRRQLMRLSDEALLRAVEARIVAREKLALEVRETDPLARNARASAKKRRDKGNNVGTMVEKWEREHGRLTPHSGADVIASCAKTSSRSESTVRNYLYKRARERRAE